MISTCTCLGFLFCGLWALHSLLRWWSRYPILIKTCFIIHTRLCRTYVCTSGFIFCFRMRFSLGGTYCCVQFNDKPWVCGGHSVVLHDRPTKTQGEGFIYLFIFCLLHLIDNNHFTYKMSKNKQTTNYPCSFLYPINWLSWKSIYNYSALKRFS